MRSAPISGKMLCLVTALLLSAALAYWWLDTEDNVESSQSEVFWPEGRWHVRDRSGDDARQRDELARVLSLPYAGTGAPAPADTGVIVHDPDRTAGGVNLYTSGHAPEAVLMDMEGRPLHVWRMPFERAFDGKRPTKETPFFRRAQLLGDGSLLAIYQGGGMVKLDPRSQIVWTVDAGLYNDFHVARDGRIYALGKEARSIPSVHPTEPVLEDSIVIISADGRVERRLSMLHCFQASPFADLLQPMPKSGDIFHSNTVDLLEGRRGEIVPGFGPGTLLVSLREVDTVALIDPNEGSVLWAKRGPWDAQHQPGLLDSGRILLFDNKGADGHSRVLEIEPLSGEIVWEWRGETGRPLSSPEGGSAQRLANGNTMITESEAGRALEITPDGTVVWEFVSPHRGGPRNTLVATLFEVLRLPEKLGEGLTR